MAGTRVEVGELVKGVGFWLYLNGEPTGVAVGGGGW